ncbi:MAG: molecular chaperone [Ruminiclostridium sp.]|nr:molecular chaperone [Ruminiclostridium sp.]
MCLSKYEKETILLTSEGDDFYDIQVYDSRLKRRLTEFAAKYPDLCEITRQDTDGCIFCIINKSRVSIRLIPPYSEERKNTARENAKKLSDRK